MNLITCEELKVKLDGGEPVKLVAVLNPWNFRAKHIPGSLNFQSVEEAKAVLHPEDEIVVYCTGWPCLNSSWAYRLLEEHGYTNVRLYQGGLVEWEAAGYAFAGEAS
jgi:rhodanese-related sulfurtransferase